jgi:hypothetical protein
MLCFDAKELSDLFELPQKRQILKELLAQGYSLDSLPPDKNKLREIAYSMNMIKDKEDIEIFLPLYAFLKFYPSDTKICYLLKQGIDPDSIDSLKSLKSSLKEYDPTDFIFWTKEGLIAHQLKAYYGEISADALFEHIRKVLLEKYANDLGMTNFLFFLHRDGNINNNLFHELHAKLKTLPLKGGGDILIAYNEAGKTDVINTVYPKLRTSRVPHRKFEENTGGDL